MCFHCETAALIVSRRRMACETLPAGARPAIGTCGWYQDERPNCFIFRQSVTVLMLSASAALAPISAKSFQRALDGGALLFLQVERVVAGRAGATSA